MRFNGTKQDLFIYIFSFLSIPIAIFFFYGVISLILGALGIINAPGTFTRWSSKEILAKNIYFFLGAIYSFLYEFIICIFLLIIFIKKFSLKKKYYWISFFYGGLGILFFFLTYSLFFTKENKKIQKKQTNFFTIFSLLPILLSTIILPFIFKKSLFSPSKYVQTEVSLDPDKPNVIEWFIDGADYELMNNNDYFRDDNFDDFTIYPKLISSSQFTNHSRTLISKGENGLWFSKNPSKLNTIMSMKKNFDNMKYPHQNNIISTTDLWGDETGKGNQNFEGGGKGIQKKYPDINVLNWTSAREAENKFINTLSPWSISYHVFSKNIKKGRPSYISMNDNAVHWPFVTSSDGKISLFFKTKNDAYKSQLKQWKKIKNRLKNIIDPKTNISAYDNTIIYIYGDHRDHGIKKSNSWEKRISLKANSVLLVKPSTSKSNTPNRPFKINKSRSIWLPHIRNIVNNSLHGCDPVKYIDTNQNFNSDRMFMTFQGTTKGKNIVRFSYFDGNDFKYVSRSHPGAKQLKFGWAKINSNAKYVDSPTESWQILYNNDISWKGPIYEKI